MAPKKNIEDKKKHTNNSEKLAIIEWLEIPNNFAQIVGSAAKNLPCSSGNKIRRIDAYNSLGAYLLKRCKTKWDVNTVRSRYESYIATYRKTVQDSRGSGFGLTNEEIQKGNDC